MRPIQFANMNKQYNFKSIDEAKNILSNLNNEDIVISLSAPSKIPVDWFAQVKAKINIHCGKLPKYAGVMPIFWQINDGLDEISITFQDLAENIDTGKVFFEKKIKPSYSLFETTRLVKRQSAHLLNEFLPNVGSNIKNVSNGQLSSDNLVLRKFPTNKEIKDFKKIHRLVKQKIIVFYNYCKQFFNIPAISYFLCNLNSFLLVVKFIKFNHWVCRIIQYNLFTKGSFSWLNVILKFFPFSNSYGCM